MEYQHSLKYFSLCSAEERFPAFIKSIHRGLEQVEGISKL